MEDWQRAREAYEALFAQEGWRMLLEDLAQEIKDAQADALEAPDWDTVCKMRGRAEKCNELLCLQEFLKSGWEAHDAALRL